MNRGLRGTGRGALLSAVSCLIFAGCPAKPKPAQPEYRLGVPDFKLPALGGANVSLSSLLGKPIVLDFWGSWCPPCRMAIPELVRLHAAYEGEVGFLGIALNDKREAADSVARELGVEYPILLGTNDVAKAYGIRDIPALYVLDAKGNLAFTETGFDADSGLVRLERVLKKLAGR